MLFSIIGVVLAVIGFFLVQGSKQSAGKSLVINMTDESSSRNLLENYESLSNTHGKGSFNLYTKLYGKAHSASPLIAEYTKKECVYYRVEIDREYEELESRTDKDGNVTKKWVRKFETVLNKDYSADDFSVQDQYGSIQINTRGAKMDTVETYSNFEKEQNQGGGSGFSFAGVTINTGPTIRTIGFTHVERSIPIGQKLFVIGQANDNAGELIISKPTEKNKPYLISIKSEKEITTDLAKSSKSKKGWGIGLIIIGVCLLIYGILTKIGIL